MAENIIGAAFALIFVGVLLMVGVLTYGYMADTMPHDNLFESETVIAAGCSNYWCNGASPCNTTFNATACNGAMDNLPIENSTRANPVVTNCTSGVCTTLTASTHYNLSASTGIIHILTDTANGTIIATYWQDDTISTTDQAQQDISNTTYSGFELATVLTIVLAAAGLIGGIFLIGRPSG